MPVTNKRWVPVPWHPATVILDENAACQTQACDRFHVWLWLAHHSNVWQQGQKRARACAQMGNRAIPSLSSKVSSSFFLPREKLYNVPFVAHEEQCRGHFADTVVGTVDPSTDGKAGVSAPEIPQPLAADMNDAGSYIFFVFTCISLDLPTRICRTTPGTTRKSKKRLETPMANGSSSSSRIEEEKKNKTILIHWTLLHNVITLTTHSDRKRSTRTRPRPPCSSRQSNTHADVAIRACAQSSCPTRRP